MAASVEKKTAMTTILDNFRSSHPEVFFKYLFQKYSRKFLRKHPWWNLFGSEMKNNILPWLFSWLAMLLNFSEQMFCRTRPDDYFSNL